MTNEIIYNETISSNKNKVVNMFAKMFSSAYSVQIIDTDYNLPNIFNFDLLSKALFSLDDVYNGLSALKNNWSVGRDEIL